MRLDITSLETLTALLAEVQAAAVLFSGPACSICHAVEPRVAELLENRFPRMGYFFVDTEAHPKAASAHQVYTIPTLVIFFEGKEVQRFARAFGIGQIAQCIERPYELLFGGD